jgi:DNA polymerase I-like protein with 3'-5' exonuclease and polymerase domains
MYFGKQDITPEEYTQAKQINFQAVYGNTPEEHKDFKLFKLIEKWTEDLWKEFSTKGYVNAPISLKRFTTDIEGMYPKKLLNYIIQSMETSRNILVLKNALQYLQTKKTKIGLYTYDSVLVDFARKDGQQTLEDLENLLSENGKYPVKFKYANDLVFD